MCEILSNATYHRCFVLFVNLHCSTPLCSAAKWLLCELYYAAHRIFSLSVDIAIQMCQVKEYGLWEESSSRLIAIQMEWTSEWMNEKEWNEDVYEWEVTADLNELIIYLRLKFKSIFCLNSIRMHFNMTFAERIFILRNGKWNGICPFLKWDWEFLLLIMQARLIMYYEWMNPECTLNATEKV